LFDEEAYYTKVNAFALTGQSGFMRLLRKKAVLSVRPVINIEFGITGWFNRLLPNMSKMV
jgi:hypothetical protein